MPNLPHVVDSTGTTMNRYTITHSDSTTETVLLDFDPSDDYVQGTPFNAASMNPLIDEVNAFDVTVTEDTPFNISGLEFKLVKVN